jgi:DNA-binding NarL/FixJ family response regulator|tara:strand:- start:1386 stop:2027 length:642 start_codon:yes stop_codon:yes gene_type:complete
MKPIRVYLIDDHHVMRQAVVGMLNEADDIVVIGHSGDPREGVDGALSSRPDIVLVDLKMPGMNGLAVIGELATRLPQAGLIVFTMHDNPAYVWETMSAGARGYVLKSADKSDLLRAVRAVASGSGYLQAEVTLPLLKRLARDACAAGERGALTSREMQILECLADGQSNKVIAGTLTITEQTVKSHLKKLYEKIGASDRAHAVAIALRQRLIE